jgi:hypothetical protein
MTDTYLSLVTDFLMETALSGGSPPETLANVTGDQLKAKYWVNQANLQILREWINWDFLWRRSTVTLSQDSEFVPNAGELVNGVTVDIVNMIKRKSLAVIQSGGDAHFPYFLDWNNSEFSGLYTYVTQPSSDTPTAWSMRPDRKIVLSSPMQTAGLTAIYDYYRKPKALLVDTDVTLVPDDFTRIIVALSKIMYAEHEDAPEVSAGAHEEYDDLLSKMEATHLPDQGFNRESHSDADLVVTPE